MAHTESTTKLLTNYNTGETFWFDEACSLCNEHPQQEGCAYCSECTPVVIHDEAEFQSWKYTDEAQEAQAHMRTLAALSDAIAIVKAEQEGWILDRYFADSRRVQ